MEALRVSAVAGRTLPHMRGPGMTQALISFENGITAIFEAILAPGGTYTWQVNLINALNFDFFWFDFFLQFFFLNICSLHEDFWVLITYP